MVLTLRVPRLREICRSSATRKSPRTTKLNDRTGDEIRLDEVERIAIWKQTWPTTAFIASPARAAAAAALERNYRRPRRRAIRGNGVLGLLPRPAPTKLF